MILINQINMWKSKTSHKKWIKHGCVLLGITAAFFLIYKYIFITEIWTMQTTNDVNYMYSANQAEDNIILDKVTTDISQTFICDSETFVGVELFFKLNFQAQSGFLDLSIIKDSTGEKIYNQSVDMHQIIDKQNVKFLLSEAIENVPGTKYKIKINTRKYKGEMPALELITTVSDTYPENELIVNGEIRSTDLMMNICVDRDRFIVPLYKGVSLFIYLFIILSYLLIFIKPQKIHRVLLICLLFLGTLYCLIMPPYSVPDEGTHCASIYQMSNEILGIPDTGNIETIYKRTEDVKTQFTPYFTEDVYKYISKNFFKLADDETLVEVEVERTDTIFLLYAPAVIGMTLGRLLHWGVVPTYFFARFCSMLFFTLLSYWAIKKLPFGKITMFIIMLFPMTIQQAASFSYDSVLNGFAFLYVALCFLLTYSEEKPKKFDIGLVLFLGFCLTLSKGGVYTPFVFLSLMIPFKRCKNRKIKVTSTIGMCVLFFVGFVLKNLSLVTRIGGATEKVVSWTDDVPGITLTYLFHNPIEFIKIVLNTLFDKTHFYISSLIGDDLGWFHITTSGMIVILFVILIVISLIIDKNEAKYITALDKGWIFITHGASIGLVLMSMLLGWTVITSNYIEGIQGRYFIPLIFGVLMLFRNNRITCERSMKKGLMFTACIVQVMTIFYMIRSIL